jgi:uncharacterized protein
MASISRRHLLGLLGGVPLAGASVGPAAGSIQTRTTGDLADAIEAIPIADVHGHAFPALAPITEDIFLEELSMAAWQMDAYFPAAYRQWKQATAADKERLDREFGIQKQLDDVVYHFRNTVFVEFLVQEMARFFKCKPLLKDVIAARNAYTQRDYWKYVNDLFAAAKLRAMFVTSALGAWTLPAINLDEFSRSVKNRVHRIFSVDPLHGSLMAADISLDEALSRNDARLRQEITQNHNLGFKSHIATRAGLDVQPWSRQEVEEAWQQYKKLSVEERRRESQGTLRPESAKKIRHYLFWQACGIAYELDVPVHVHSGDGGEGQGNLSRQYPYNLENVIRYPVEFPQKPLKVVMIHGGYPHVDQAAYLTHIFNNVWYDTSFMNPLANRGLHERMLTILETAPVTKVMHGSDGYHVPEFFYVAAKWGRRYTASALAVLVNQGIYTKDRAVEAARLMLWENAHRLHKLTPN